MVRVGFFLSNKIDAIYPSHPKDLKTWCSITMPQLYECLDVIQIDNKYLLSIGAHASNANLILSAEYDISVDYIRRIENIVSYIFDAPCMFDSLTDKKISKKYYSGLKNYYRFIGHVINENISEQDIGSNLLEGSCDSISDGYMRLLPKDMYDYPENKVWSIDSPDNQRLSRGIVAYRQALLSFEPQGKILNYWRVLEAVTNSVESRYQLARDIKSFKLQKVRSYYPFGSSEKKPFNLMTKYKRRVVKYLENLVCEHGSVESVMDYFFEQRRCPIAHAKRDILDVTESVTLASLYEDALLLKYLSRCAIEKYWKEII